MAGWDSDTTGPFTQGGRVYGVQNITDGTSNTIAFGESLVGDATIQTGEVAGWTGALADVGHRHAAGASWTSTRLACTTTLS